MSRDVARRTDRIHVDRLSRLLPLSGAVAVALQVVAFVVGGWSGYRPRAEEAAAIFEADPSRIEAAALIGGFYSLGFLAVFVGCVASAIRREDDGDRLADIALVGGIVAVIALAIGYRFLNAAAFQAGGDEGITGEAATIMFRLYSSSFAGFVSFGLAAMLGAVGLAALTSRLLPEWLAWVSIVASIGLLTPAHGLFEGFALLWIVFISVLLTTSGGAPAQGAASPDPTASTRPRERPRDGRRSAARKGT